MRHRLPFRLITLTAALSLSVLVGACSGGGDDDDDGATSPTPSCTPIGITLSALQSAVFTPNCTVGSSCHASEVPGSENLDLSAGQTHGETVGVQAQQTFNGSAINLVEPGSKEASYLYLKVLGATGIQGVAMPQTGQLLCQEKIDAIGAWIDAGAMDN